MGDLVLGVLLQHMVRASLPVFTCGKELKSSYKISHKLMGTLCAFTGAIGRRVTLKYVSASTLYQYIEALIQL